MVQPILSRVSVVAQLRALGVHDGGVLLVHTSFRAVRPIEDGPLGLIDALREAIGPTGTLVMPSWTQDDDAPFDPRTTPVATDLGIVASTLCTLTGSVRSDHPFAFTAIGPHAEDLVLGPLPLPPHAPDSPVGRVFDRDGQVLLLGVGHDANTTIHLAELRAPVPYGVAKHCTVFRDGRPERVPYVENDCCCARFALADSWLRERGLQREGPVGHAQARLLRATDIIMVVGEQLARDPLVFLHPPAEGCDECDAARTSVVR